MGIPNAKTRFLRQDYPQLANDTMLEVWVPGTGYSDNHDTAVLSYCPSAVSDEVANSVIETFRVQLTEVAET